MSEQWQSAVLATAAAAPARPQALVVAVLVTRAVLAVAVTLWLAALVPTLLGMRLSTVMSGSMAPAFQPGDAVIVRPAVASDLRVGQVLLVDDPDRPGRLRLHRLVALRSGDLELRGDANPTPDTAVVAPQHLRGVAVLRVPLAGLPDLWLRSAAFLPLGLFAVALGGACLLACTDVAPALSRRPPRILGAPGALRAGGAGLVLLLAALPTLATGGQGWAVFSGIATSSTNTIGASTLFNNCPARSAGLPTPSLYYAYTATSGTAETDLAGTADGTVTAATRTAGYCDGSAPSPYLLLSDPSSTGAVTVGTKTANPPVAFSVSLWLRPGNAGTGIVADFTDSNGVGNQTITDRQIYYRTDGSLAFGVRFGSGTGTPVLCSTAAPSTGVWHSVTATATTGGVLTLYVDGAQACTVTGSGYAPGGAAGGGFWAFGAEHPLNAAAWGESSTTTGFVGGLDETTVYGSALSSAAVSALFTAGH